MTSHSFKYLVPPFSSTDELFLRLRESIPNLIRSHLRTCANLEEHTTPVHSENTYHHVAVNGRSWNTKSTSQKCKDYDVLYIGGEGRTLTNLMMVMNGSRFHSYNPVTNSCRQETVNVNKALMKRLYLIEKAKDANIVGIVVGTLAVSNFLLIHNHLKELIKKAGE